MLDIPVNLMRRTAQYAALLDGGAALPPIHAWRARCVGLVEDMLQAATEAGLSAADIAEASLAQCVLLDELTLDALPATAHDEWLRERLQVRYHGVRDGAAQVWNRIEALLDGERRDLRALALYGVMLELGFSGGRDDADVYRRRVRSALIRSGHVDPGRASPASTMQPVQGIHIASAPGVRRVPWAVCGAVAAMFAAGGLWSAFDAVLATAARHLPQADSAPSRQLAEDPS